MILMQVFLEAFRAMGIAESAVARGSAHHAGIDITRFSEYSRIANLKQRKP